MKYSWAAGLAFIGIAACTSSIQTTSGADYLARYDGSYEVAGGACGSDTDADVKRIAAIEPDLHFPARIGLARIGPRGNLAPVPASELAIWGDLATSLGEAYGEFVPVSPMIAAMVSDEGEGSSREVIDHIRRGAARQHLDYVLVYETASESRNASNALALADLTIIGMFVLPSRDVKAEATVSAILLDVRNGYPYATLTAFADRKGLSRAVSSWSTRQELAASAEEKAVLELANDVRDTLPELAKATKTEAPLEN